MAGQTYPQPSEGRAVNCPVGALRAPSSRRQCAPDCESATGKCHRRISSSVVNLVFSQWASRIARTSVSSFYWPCFAPLLWVGSLPRIILRLAPCTKVAAMPYWPTWLLASNYHNRPGPAPATRRQPTRQPARRPSGLAHGARAGWNVGCHGQPGPKRASGQKTGPSD